MEENITKLTDQIMLWLKIAWFIGFSFGSVIGIGSYVIFNAWIEKRRKTKQALDSGYG